MATGSANITVAPNIMSHVGFRLVQLELILTYSKSQPGHRNGVLSNISSLLSYDICHLIEAL